MRIFVSRVGLLLLAAFLLVTAPLFFVHVAAAGIVMGNRPAEALMTAFGDSQDVVASWLYAWRGDDGAESGV